MNLVTLPPPSHRNGRHSLVSLDRHATRTNRSAQRSRFDQSSEMPALRLGHVHFKVRDLNRSVPFYTRILGLRLTEWVGRYAFLSTGVEHHSVALEEVGAWSVNPSRRAVGVAHVAFQVPDRATFAAMRKKLAAANLPFISRNNGISWAIRFKDPDGNEIEIYVDRRRSPGGTNLWGGRWHGSRACDDEPALVTADAA